MPVQIAQAELKSMLVNDGTTWGNCVVHAAVKRNPVKGTAFSPYRIARRSTRASASEEMRGSSRLILNTLKIGPNYALHQRQSQERLVAECPRLRHPSPRVLLFPLPCPLHIITFPCPILEGQWSVFLVTELGKQRGRKTGTPPSCIIAHFFYPHISNIRIKMSSLHSISISRSLTQKPRF